MLSDQAYKETQILLDKKYEKLNKNIQKNIIIENLINKLDNTVINFNIDLDGYKKIASIIKDKISEFNSNDKIGRNIYVNRLSDKPIRKRFIGCYKNVNKQMDVLEEVMNLYDNNNGTFNITNGNMNGDPVPGTRKKLYVVYSLNGKNQHESWDEGTEAEIPYPGATILKARYGEKNNMEYVSNFNINQCKKYAYNTQSAYFSVNNIDDERECYVGDNLNSLIKDGESIKTVPLWQHNFSTNNLNSNVTSSSSISGLQLRILNTTFAVVDNNNKVIYSNDFVTANNEMSMSPPVQSQPSTYNNQQEGFKNRTLDNSEYVFINNENISKTNVKNNDDFLVSLQQMFFPAIQEPFNWKDYRRSFNTNTPDVPLNPNLDKQARLLLTNNGRLILREYNTTTTKNKKLWKPSYTRESSIVVKNWIPENDPTNKYKRDYLITGEFLDINESITSQNGKYKLEFTDNGLRILKANISCVGRPRIGDETSNALYMVQDSEYDVKYATVSSSDTTQSYPNLSFGECMKTCNDTEECNAFEWRWRDYNCSLKKNIGNVSDKSGTRLAIKNDYNDYSNSSYLGKIGYVDENDVLYEYPDNMIKYDNTYKKNKDMRSNGNVISRYDGDKYTGMFECNKLSNCAGFIYNKENNSVSLYNNSIYPRSNKFFDDDTDLFLRNFKIENHNSCPKDIFKVNANTWKNYELLNKITVFNENTQKCGLINIINSDLNELKRIYRKLNEYTNIVDETIKELIGLNVEIKGDVVAIQKRITKTMSFLVDTNSEFDKTKNRFKTEGFTSNISHGELINPYVENNMLVYSMISVLLIGFVAYTHK